MATKTNPKPQLLDKEDLFGEQAYAAARAKEKANFAEVKAELLHFWEIGHKSLAKRPHYPFGRSNFKAAEAAKLGWNKEKIRQARAFAGRCSKKELEQRIAEARDADHYAPHWTILVTIYQLTNKAQRLSIWERCLADHPSRQELADRIRGEGLSRDLRATGSGRKWKPPRSPEEAQHRLRQAVDHVLRLEQTCGKSMLHKNLAIDARLALSRSVKALTDLKAALPPEKKPPQVRRRSKA